MSKILTAKEYILRYGNRTTTKEDLMIGFAELHVQAALEVAYKNTHRYYDPAEGEYDVDRDSIILAYPLTNIK